MRSVALVFVALAAAAVDSVLSMKILPHNDFYGETGICIPDTIFYNACSRCACPSSGKDASCTKFYCPTPVKPRIDGFLTGNGLACPPGKKFFDSEVECTCGETGKEAICDSDVITAAPYAAEQNYPHNDFFGETEVCIPGQIFFDRCNLCTCNTSGNAADCYRMYCPAPVKPRIDGFLTENGLTCPPGKKFFDNDIECSCTDSGRDAECDTEQRPVWS